jgi:ubiquinone/menaquinone biosynthesis C-methylase UbiE
VEIIYSLFAPAFVEAFDVDPDQVARARRCLGERYKDTVDLYVGSATDIRAKSEKFDAVFDFGALHHVPENQKAIHEIARVLRPGGRFFFMEIPANFTMDPVIQFLTRHAPEAQFAWEELAGRLAAAGLDVRENSHRKGLTRLMGVAWKRGGKIAGVQPWGAIAFFPLTLRPRPVHDAGE